MPSEQSKQAKNRRSFKISQASASSSIVLWLRLCWTKCKGRCTQKEGVIVFRILFFNCSVIAFTCRIRQDQARSWSEIVHLSFKDALDQDSRFFSDILAHHTAPFVLFSGCSWSWMIQPPAGFDLVWTRVRIWSSISTCFSFCHVLPDVVHWCRDPYFSVWFILAWPLGDVFQAKCALLAPRAFCLGCAAGCYSALFIESSCRCSLA